MIRFQFAFIFVLSFNLIPAAHAENCEPLKLGAVQKIYLLSNQGMCSSAQDLGTTLEDIQEQLGLKASVTLVMGPPSDNASFDDGHIIQIPALLTHVSRFGEESFGNLMQLPIVVAHEYGHALLAEILRQKFTNEFKEVTTELMRVSNEAEEAIISNKQPPRAQYNFSDKELAAFYFNVTTPYSELFADTVAVFYFEDPTIMIHGLYFDDLSDQEFKYIKTRDFSSAHTLEEISRFGDSHSKLSLVRSFIGKNMMPKTKNEKSIMIKKLADAIVGAIQADLKLYKVPTEKVANEQVIELLKKSLRH